MSFHMLLASLGHPGSDDLKRLTDILRPAGPCELFRENQAVMGIAGCFFWL